MLRRIWPAVPTVARLIVLALVIVVTAKLTGGIGQLMKAHGVQVVHGTAQFGSATKLSVESADGNHEVSAKNFLIATGSSSIQIPGFEFDGIGEDVANAGEGRVLLGVLGRLEGDPELQQAVRFGLFQVVQAAARAESAIGATGDGGTSRSRGVASPGRRRAPPGPPRSCRRGGSRRARAAGARAAAAASPSAASALAGAAAWLLAPLAVLRALADQPGHVVSRRELMGHLPSGLAASEHAVEVAVARLRSAVGPRLVQTVVKRGYRLPV